MTSPAAAVTPTVFSFTGTEQTYTVPGGTDRVQVTAIGGKGGSSGQPGGLGADVSGTLTVTPGETALHRGGRQPSDPDGTAAFNGGGARLPHVFQAYSPILDEAATALDRAGQLLLAHLAGTERVTV